MGGSNPLMEAHLNCFFFSSFFFLFSVLLSALVSHAWKSLYSSLRFNFFFGSFVNVISCFRAALSWVTAEGLHFPSQLRFLAFCGFLHLFALIIPAPACCFSNHSSSGVNFVCLFPIFKDFAGPSLARLTSEWLLIRPSTPLLKNEAVSVLRDKTQPFSFVTNDSLVVRIVRLNPTAMDQTINTGPNPNLTVRVFRPRLRGLCTDFGAGFPRRQESVLDPGTESQITVLMFLSRLRRTKINVKRFILNDTSSAESQRVETHTLQIFTCKGDHRTLTCTFFMCFFFYNLMLLPAFTLLCFALFPIYFEVFIF
ncbi:uncharacterized protein LOC120440057 [Oreochromis aureus]|uniref:uncharacterized protein LOC120440057 n=1 Tax=Oreochromis aureus TaxID=47969 RepID=UPI001953C540|nr:uncharacterized protein LOC120440057 [Oreochromis aureus]